MNEGQHAIVQLIPAPDWDVAWYEAETDSIVREPLVAWGVVHRWNCESGPRCEGYALCDEAHTAGWTNVEAIVRDDYGSADVLSGYAQVFPRSLSDEAVGQQARERWGEHVARRAAPNVVQL